MTKEFTAFYESYSSLLNKIQRIAKVTGFQAVIYDEQENFQSFEILDNFNYPFANRKQVKDTYFAEVPTNDSSTKIETHRFYMQNSVTCLQSNWWNAFGFVKSTFIAG